MFSESISAEGKLFARVKLRDGSIIVGEVREPSEITLKTGTDKRLKVELKDILSIIGDPLFVHLSNVHLKDGKTIEAVVRVEQIRILPVWSRYYCLPIRWQYIHSIWFFKDMSSAIPVGSVKPGSTWGLQTPLLLSTTSKGPGPAKIYKFCEEFDAQGINATGWSDPSLVAAVAERLEDLKAYNTIFLVHPKNLEQLDELAVKYPELVPVPYNELIKVYSAPLLYFLRDARTNRIRGIVITEWAGDALAKLLIKKPIPLGVPFRYENIISPFWKPGEETLKILNE